MSPSASARAHRAAAGSWPAACALGFGAVVLLGYRDGGYYAETWSWAALALAAIAGIPLLVRRPVALSRLEFSSLAGLACLAAWMLLSTLWGIEGTEGQREAERCGLYALGLGALLVVVRASAACALLVGVLGGTVALATVALADRVLSTPELDPYQGALLKEPVGYANALGILMAIGVALALGMFLGERRAHAQIALVGAGALCGVALALTSSRGAWVATAVGVTVLAAFRARSNGRRRLLPVASFAAIAAAAILLVVPRMSFGDRPMYWSVATDDAAGHVLLGSGAGSFDDYWREHRPIPANVRDAHSLYLETAAELGLVGLVLLLCTLGAPLVAATRARDRRLAATAAAAYSAFLVHAGLDWDWEMPVTTFAGLACAAALLVAARRA